MSSDDAGSVQRVLDFLTELREHTIAYSIDSVRDAIVVSVVVPGQRWEVEFFADGHVEIERFLSTGEIEGEELLRVLIDEYGDARDTGEIDNHWEDHDTRRP